jgi:orotidine-5'-phosphate decarboxylase
MAISADAAGRVIVALDYPDAESARQAIKALRGIPCTMKVGLQLFYAAGPDFIRELKQEGYRVFLDVKMHDIPNTVRGGAESVTRLGADMFNVHAAGGRAMMEAAVEGMLRGMNARPGEAAPLLIAVTQLTSTSREVMNEQIGIPGTVEEAVVRYAALAREAGLDGVVASPHEVRAVKQACGIDFVTVTPGIRPAGSELGDQSRVMTPQEAFAQGTDYIVVGRPVTAAPSPREALESLIRTVQITTNI